MYNIYLQLLIQQQLHKHTHRWEYKLVYSLDYGVKESERLIKDFFNKSKNERAKISKMAREYALKYYSHKVWMNPHAKEYLD